MTAIINPTSSCCDSTIAATPVEGEELPHDEQAIMMTTAMSATSATTDIKGHHSHSSPPQPRDSSKSDYSNNESNTNTSNSEDGSDPAPPPSPPKQEQWDLRIRYGSPQLETYNHPLKHDDVVIVPEFYGDEDDWTIYHQLLHEIQELQNADVAGTAWKRCPKAVGKHYVCANPMKCSKFKEICTKVCQYFGIKRDETLEFTLSWYKKNDDMQTPRHEEECVLLLSAAVVPEVFPNRL